MVVLSLKIGNNEPLEPFSIGLRSDHECRRTSSPRIHGIRRRDRRRRAVGPCCCDPPEAAQCRSQDRRGGEGFRGRRAYPVGRRDRSGFARQADPGLARGRGLSAQDAGQGRPLLLDYRDQRDPAAELRFAAAEVLYDDSGAVRGIATGDMGVGRDGKPKDSFTRGMELLGKYTLFAEGARGSLSKQLIAKYALDAKSEPPKFGIGLKEVWEIDPAKHQKGLIQHSFGWPLNNSTGGGSFLYHYDDNLVAVGFVVHLNYDDPYLSPFDEFQRFKTHPSIRALFEGGKRLAYGARAITEGGYQSVPRLTFAGGALIGCAAGFVNVPRIKGVHNAMGSGMLAAEHLAAALAAGRGNDQLAEYENAWRDSAVGKDLHRVRNVKPLWSKFGTIIGVALGGFDMWCNTMGFSLFGTQSHAKPDRKTLGPAKTHTPIVYPKPDGKISFDKLSSVFLSNTNHEEDQPVHLKVADMNLQKASEHGVYAGPSNRYCPAGVYEWVEEAAGLRYQINAQNCVHCKTCDVKDPNGNITWVPPEGGGGPNYEAM